MTIPNISLVLASTCFAQPRRRLARPGISACHPPIIMLTRAFLRHEIRFRSCIIVAVIFRPFFSGFEI
jgi:hypothetical protein